MTKKETAEIQGKFLQLRSQGQNYEAIAPQLGVNVDTLLEWSRDLQDQLRNLRAIRYEALQEKAYATKEKHAELLADRIGKIKAELDTRELTDVPTRVLEELLIKYATLVDPGRESITFSVTEENEYGSIETNEWQG